MEESRRDNNQVAAATAYRGLCLYPSAMCTNERDIKKNGKPHTLCAFHRAKHNQHQRKFDAKKKNRFTPYDAPPLATPPPPPPRVPGNIRQELRQIFWRRVHIREPTPTSQTISSSDNNQMDEAKLPLPPLKVMLERCAIQPRSSDEHG
ncbi:hypothetical protein AC1031_009951 [Aphanomyces cochlioides]|nr:hypothetical protein AC1031_009951 [Aphanomyces cochlioides]